MRNCAVAAKLRMEADLMTQQRKTSVASRAKGLVTVVALVAGLLAAAIFMTRGQESTASVEDTPSLPQAAGFQVGDRAFPEQRQADEYRSAMSAGNAHSLALVETALQQAESQSPRNEVVVQRLKSELERRQATLTMLGAASK